MRQDRLSQCLGTSVDLAMIGKVKYFFFESDECARIILISVWFYWPCQITIVTSAESLIPSSIQCAFSLLYNP